MNWPRLPPDTDSEMKKKFNKRYSTAIDLRFNKQDDPELEETVRKRKIEVGKYLSKIKKHLELKQKIIPRKKVSNK